MNGAPLENGACLRVGGVGWPSIASDVRGAGCTFESELDDNKCKAPEDLEPVHHILELGEFDSCVTEGDIKEVFKGLEAFGGFRMRCGVRPDVL